MCHHFTKILFFGKMTLVARCLVVVVIPNSRMYGNVWLPSTAGRMDGAAIGDEVCRNCPEAAGDPHVAFFVR